MSGLAGTISRDTAITFRWLEMIFGYATIALGVVGFILVEVFAIKGSHVSLVSGRDVYMTLREGGFLVALLLPVAMFAFGLRLSTHGSRASGLLFLSVPTIFLALYGILGFILIVPSIMGACAVITFALALIRAVFGAGQAVLHYAEGHGHAEATSNT